MSDVLSCTCGHRWTAPSPLSGAAPDPAWLDCPRCGARVTQPTSWGVAELGERPTWAGDTERLARAGLARTVGPPSFRDIDLFGFPTVAGYEVVAELGRGGMGIVYLARQQSLNRLVALKMVLAGAALGSAGLARFRAEAEAVARLQHPNIVQIYEIGEHEGLPFFSLEYVNGGNLDQHLRGRVLPAREVAALVETLARAIDYAHRRGVIHRDLKPANILMAGVAAAPAAAFGAGGTTGSSTLPGVRPGLRDFTPKVADFGLAKRLDEEAAHTRTGFVMGTPNYMAPEQALGRRKDMGPATDVYSLGAVLYELLANVPPFWGEASADTLTRVIHEEPISPSRYRPAVPRDLEVICLKCLEKVPARRYASAFDLADDLRRFLAGEPIRARPAAALERTIKWSRRHPALAAVLALSAVTLSAVLSLSLVANVRLRERLTALQEANARLEADQPAARHQRDRAESERRRAAGNYLKARRAVDLLLTRVGQEHLAHVPGLAEDRRSLLEEALAFYEEVRDQEASDPAALRETARAHRRVGDLSRLLGDRARAETSYRQAVALLDALSRDGPSDAGARAELAAGRLLLGQFLRATGQPREAQEQLDQARSLLQALRADDGAARRYRQLLGRTWAALALLARDRHDLPAAEAALGQALELQQGLVDESPGEAEGLQDLAESYHERARLFQVRRDLTAAEKDLRAALRQVRRLEQQSAGTTEFRWKSAALSHDLGTVLLALALRRPAELTPAEQALRTAVQAREQLAASFPAVASFQRALADSHVALAGVLLARNDLSGAEGHDRQAETILRALVRRDDTAAEHRSALGSVLDDLAAVARRSGDTARARELLAEALPHHEAALRAGGEAYRAGLRTHFQILAEALLAEGKVAEAVRAAEELTRRFPDSGPEHYQAAVLCARLADLAGKVKPAGTAHPALLPEPFAARAVQLLRSALGKGYTPAPPLDQDPSLASLRGRADFRELLGR